MKILCTFILLGLTACVSAQDGVVSSTPKCMTDAQILADVKAALASAEERSRTGEPAPVKPEDAKKTPAQLAEEAAMSSPPCDAQQPATNMPELPQVN
jgi:hypothetical protein